jgi:type II secretory pathway pseudopilin PulG
MIIKFQRKKTGFTLLETMVYISITTILFLSLTSFVLFMKNVENNADSKWAIERESRKIFSFFEIILNDTKGIDLPNDGNNAQLIRFDITTPSNDPSEIYFENRNLFLDIGGDVEKINSDNVFISDFNIYNLSDNSKPETFRVSFTINSTTTENTIISENFYSTFTLRDYE